MDAMIECINNNIDLVVWIIAVSTVVAIYLIPSKKESNDSELHSRNRYKKTAELDEMINDDQIFLNP